MALPPSCPPGYGPDIIFRFPLEPFFPEPYGSDCWFHEIGFQAFGGIVLILAAISFIAHVMTLPQPESRLFTFVRVAHLVHLSSAIAIVIVGLLDSSKTYIPIGIFTCLFVTVGDVWMYLGYKTVIRTMVNVQAKKDVTAVTLIGGPCNAFMFLFLAGIMNLCVQIFMYMLLVNMSKGDIAMAAICYRLCSASIGFCCVTFAVASWVVLTKFLGIVEESLRRQQTTAGAEESEFHTVLRDIIRRFRVIRRTFLVSAVGAAISEFLQAAVLPVFWYLLLIHIMTTVVCGLGLLLTITGPKKRERILNQLAMRKQGKQQAMVVMNAEIVSNPTSVPEQRAVV